MRLARSHCNVLEAPGMGVEERRRTPSMLVFVHVSYARCGWRIWLWTYSNANPKSGIFVGDVAVWNARLLARHGR